jgi:Ca2+/H+ antiporter
VDARAAGQPAGADGCTRPRDVLELPEFFVVLFALDAGEIRVAQTSLIGSVLANGLLVLGLTIIIGAAALRTA